MRKLILLGLLLAGLVALLPVEALASETVPNQGTYFPQPGNRKIDGNLWVTGEFYSGATKTDGSVFLSALDHCQGDTATFQNGLLPTRGAANLWGLARTAAAAETINYTCNINSWLQRYGATTGIKITSMALVYSTTVADLTTHTFNGLKYVTFANGSAIVMSSALTGTVTLATASTANPYVTTITPTTAAYFPTAVNTGLNLDGTVVVATNGVFYLWGVQVNFTRADN